MGHRSSFGVMAVGIVTAVAAYPTTAMADSGVEWGKRALRLQNQIDNAAPFTNSMWVGTHNSFNAFKWDSAYRADPNQRNTPQEQLDHGARELTFDLHWSSATTSMLLCHGSCSGSEKTFRKGLDEIRDFLDDGNRDEVILLKLELTKNSIDDKFSKLTNQLEGAIGARIYKPSHHGLSTGCLGLNPAKISKQAVIDAGKNIVVIYTPQPDKGCASNGSFNDWVFTGFKFDDGTTKFKFESPKSTSDCETIEVANGKMRMSRVHDGATWFGIADGNDGIEIRAGNVNSYMKAGLNIFELFNFNGENAATSRPYLKPQDLVWSWGTGEPNNSGGKEHCAESRSDHRFNDQPCNTIRPYACRDGAGNWKITPSSGAFGYGDMMCKQKFGSGFSFAVPVNARENQRLINAKGSVGAVWLNYQDLSMEGQWIANSSTRLPFANVSSVGGSGGSSFDDIEEMKVDLYRSAPRRVTKVTMRSGRRVDKVALTYSDGRSVSHGGSGGSESTLTLGSNEVVNRYDICVDKHDGSNRIFHLKLYTNTGRSIGGGDKQGSCTSGSYSGKHLFGFHGRSGASVDALGFYFRG